MREADGAYRSPPVQQNQRGIEARPAPGFSVTKRRIMFPVGLYLLALIGGAALSAASLPLWRRWCLRVGLMDAPGHRKIHDTPVPLAGGLAVMTGLALPILAASLWSALGSLPEPFANAVSHGLSRRGWQLAAILGGAVAMLGARHSRRPTRSLPKMEIPRAGAHRAGRCRERHPRDNLCREPGFQLHHHCVVDSHRHQRGQFSGQHERPLPGTWA